MRLLKNLRDYWALRAHLREPWAFMQALKSPQPDGDFEVAFKDGFSVRCQSPRIDRHVLKGIFARDEYRLNGRAAGAWDTVLDIGANIGLFSVRVAPLARRVFAYEPMPGNFKYLTANLAGERFRHVVPVAKAVSGKPGTLDLFVSDKNPAAHTMIAGAQEGGTKVSVEAVTFGQIFAEHRIERCNLLKMDIEGAEYDSLQGMPDDHWARIDRIHMEYHPGPAGWDREKLAAFLRERGYAVELVPHRRHPEYGNLFATRR